MVVIDAKEGMNKNKDDIRGIDHMFSSLSLTAHEARNTAIHAMRIPRDIEGQVVTKVENELQAIRKIAEGRPQDSGQVPSSVAGSAIGTMIYKNKEMIDTMRSSSASSFQYFDKKVQEVEVAPSDRFAQIENEADGLKTKVRSDTSAAESHTKTLEGQVGDR